MRGGIRNHRREHRRIEYQHRTGDARHAASHDDEQLAAGEAGEIGPDEQRRLDMTDEDIGRGRQPNCAADADGPFQRPGEGAHHRRHNAPVEQDRGEHAHHQQDRQCLQREHEFGAGHLQIVGQRPAAEIAEHERGSRPGGRANCTDRLVDVGESRHDWGHFQQSDGGDDSDGKRDAHMPPGYGAAAFAEQPGNGEDRDHANCRLCRVHALPQYPGERL